jgi:hypothetical protein
MRARNPWDEPCRNGSKRRPTSGTLSGAFSKQTSAPNLASQPNDRRPADQKKTWHRSQ